MSGVLGNNVAENNANGSSRQNGPITLTSINPGTTSRRSSAPAVSPIEKNEQPSLNFSPDQWKQKLSSITINTEELDKLVMDFLVIEGHKQAAENFAKETGIQHDNLDSISARTQIRECIKKGHVSEAIDFIIELDPELLDIDEKTQFMLRQQEMIEMVRKGQEKAALTFAKEQLAPRALKHSHLLRDLEKSMFLLVFPDHPVSRKLTSLENRNFVSQQVNAALLKREGKETESKLPKMLKELTWIQENVRGDYPRIIDFERVQFSPDLGNSMMMNID